MARNITKTLKLSPEDVDLIEEKACQSNMSFSAYLREAALHSVPQENHLRSEIAKELCLQHNLVEDSQSLEEIKSIVHKKEQKIWLLLK